MTSNQIKRPLGLQLLIYGFVLFWLILAAFPFIWTMWGSFKVELDFFSKADWTNVFSGVRTQAVYGESFTGAGYEGAWIQEEFWRAFLNTAIVCFFTVLTSLTLATLGGYALSRSGLSLFFLAANNCTCFFVLCLQSLLFLGIYNPSMIGMFWGTLPTTIIVLVAINQPFTLWMLHSFFQTIPKELDESAKVDGCTQFQAFRHVIIPVMWPGVITAGLFSFLLAYNDFAVTAILLSQENQTMVPKIASFMGTTQTEGNIMFAVAAVVSAIVPLFILVMFFQRQLVSGLTAGAVKG